MTFNWEQYLEIAELLYNGGLANRDDEGVYRNVISRAYYAALNIARLKKFANDGIKVPEGSDSHKFVSNYFENHSDDFDFEVGKTLKELKFKRKSADYIEADHISSLEAEQAILDARDIVSCLSESPD